VTTSTKFPPEPEPVSETVKIEVPEPVIEVGLRLAVTPVGEPRTFADSLTVPLKPFPDLSWIVLVALVEPVGMVSVAGDANREK